MRNLRQRRRAKNGTIASSLGLIGLKTKSTDLSSEKEIENFIIDQLNLMPETFVWKNNTTGVYDPVRQCFRKLSKRSIKGVSDILGISHGRMLCLEVKSAKGRVSPDQKAFLERMKALGAVTGVVRSWLDVVGVLRDLKPCNPCK
jgi:hypothetical protein